VSEDESLGELGEWDEVTHSRRGKDGYVGFLIHFVDGFFWVC